MRLCGRGPRFTRRAPPGVQDCGAPSPRRRRPWRRFGTGLDSYGKSRPAPLRALGRRSSPRSQSTRDRQAKRRRRRMIVARRLTPAFAARMNLGGLEMSGAGRVGAQRSFEAMALSVAPSSALAHQSRPRLAFARFLDAGFASTAGEGFVTVQSHCCSRNIQEETSSRPKRLALGPERSRSRCGRSDRTAQRHRRRRSILRTARRSSAGEAGSAFGASRKRNACKRNEDQLKLFYGLLLGSIADEIAHTIDSIFLAHAY